MAKDKIKLVSSKVRVHELVADDRFKIGGVMFRVLENLSGSYGNGRHLIVTHDDNRTDNASTRDRNSIFLQPGEKITIYNQPVPKKTKKK